MASEHWSPTSDYCIHGLIVRSFKGKKYLSVPKEDFQFEEIDDIGAVNDAQLEQSHLLRNVAVQGVKYFDSYSGCYACKGKVVKTPGSMLGKCNRCNTLQRLDSCSQQITAKLELYSHDNQQSKVLLFFSPTIEEICATATASAEQLLFSDSFDVEYSDEDIALSIQR